MKNCRRVEYEDRCQLHALVKRGLTQEEIAAALGFSQGTVSRELKRNRGKRGYRFKQAQSKTAHRQHAVRQIARKLTNVLRRRIERKCCGRIGGARSRSAVGSRRNIPCR